MVLSPNSSSTWQLPATTVPLCGTPCEVILYCSLEKQLLSPRCFPFRGNHPGQYTRSERKTNPYTQHIADAAPHVSACAQTLTPSLPSHIQVHDGPTQVPGKDTQHQVLFFTVPQTVSLCAHTALHKPDRVSVCVHTYIHTQVPPHTYTYTHSAAQTSLYTRLVPYPSNSCPWGSHVFHGLIWNNLYHGHLHRSPSSTMDHSVPVPRRRSTY